MKERARAAAALMFLSGVSALVYEIVWMRMLARAFGVTVHAVAGLTALYMGGLALGAALAARLLSGKKPLRTYAWLELGAGAAAVLGTVWLVRLPALAAAFSSGGPLPALARLLLAAPALLPATVLLGATLPVMTRHAGAPGRLYAANTLGAAFGAAAAAFWIIGERGETAAILLAASANAAAALTAFTLSRGASKTNTPVAPSTATPAKHAHLVAALFALSGFCALAYEVLWSRQLVPLIGNSTYAFSMVLIVILLGIGLGSTATPPAKGEDAFERFAFLLLGLGAAAAAGAAAYRFLGMSADSPDFLYSPLRRFSDIPMLGVETAIIVLPAAVLMGALFPAAVAAGRRGGEDASTGRLYAWNTVGGILGSLWAGFYGAAWLGPHRSWLLLAGVQTAAGLGAVVVSKPRRKLALAAAGLAAVAALSAVYARHDPTLEMLGARLRRSGMKDFSIMFHDRSAAATITGVESGAAMNLYINGIETSGNGQAGALMVILPDLMVDQPRANLVICLGAGNTFRAASRLVDKVDGVELVGDVAKRMTAFHPDLAEHLARPGRSLFVEDGRNFLLRSKDRWDVIVVDAAPPLYSAGTVNLYTMEFLNLARAHLTPGGIFALWLPTRSFESDYWRILAGTAAAFPHVAIWSQQQGNGFLILASENPLERPAGFFDRRIKERLKDFAKGKFDEGVVRTGFRFTEEQIRARVKGVEPVTDDKPTVEFPLLRFWRDEPVTDDNIFLEEMRARTDVIESSP